MSSQSTDASSSSSLLLGGTSRLNHPYILYAATNRPPDKSVGGAGGAHSRDPVQVLCPHTGSNVTASHPLRTPPSSSGGGGRGGSFGVRCLVPVPLSTMLGGGAGGDAADSGAALVGHGGDDSRPSSSSGGGAGKDDHVFLLSRFASGGGGLDSSVSSATRGANPLWKIRPPEALSHTPRSMAASPDGRYLAAGGTSGTCFLWDWTATNGPGGGGSGNNNLARVWKAHHRAVTCVAFDPADGATLFTAGEDGVVHAWCVLDLVDRDSGAGGGAAALQPFRTWSEHHLPVTSLCVLPGGGCGSTRLVSSSMDRNIVLMELGGTTSAATASSAYSADGGSGSGARTLARMCLPSGIRCVTCDSTGGRLYGGGADGTVYVVDLDGRAVRETSDGAASFVYADGGGGGGPFSGGFESLLSGDHLGPNSTGASNKNFVSELKGHSKAVTSLVLLDPADLITNGGGGGGGGSPLLASGSEDGTVRIWNLRSRSCVRVMNPWSSSPSEGTSTTTTATDASSKSAPPVIALIAAPKSVPASLSGNTFASSGRRSGGGPGGVVSLFRPLDRFVRGDGGGGVCVPALLRPRRDESSTRFWEGDGLAGTTGGKKRNKRARDSLVDANGDGDNKQQQPSNSDQDMSDEEDGGDAKENNDEEATIKNLRKELEDAQSAIERWQKVNNELVTRLKNEGASSG